MTASERDALEQGIRMALSHASERKMTAAMLEVYQPADAHDARVESEAWAALAAVALRELERAGGRDALWREYEEARENFENSAKLYQFASDSESLSDLARDRARLDAAVRALAAAPPAEPREREDGVESEVSDFIERCGLAGACEWAEERIDGLDDHGVRIAQAVLLRAASALADVRRYVFTCEVCGQEITDDEPFDRWADDVLTHKVCPTPAAPREREARELSTLRVAGEPFKCVCGANVFRAVDGIYMCNACGEEYSGDPREREGEEA